MTLTLNIFLNRFAVPVRNAGLAMIAALSGAMSAGAVGLGADGAMPETIFANSPLYFEANRGQMDSEIRFLSRGHSCNFFIAPTEAVLTLNKVDAQSPLPREEFVGLRRSSVETRSIRLRFAGANANAQVSGAGELSGKVNYFMGNDPSKWRANVPLFTRTRVEEIYPGVDLIYYGNQQRLEFDFIVSAAANPAMVSMNIEGADKIQLNGQGDLVLTLGNREIRQQKPVAYQLIDGARKEIPCAYKIKNERTIVFQVGDYDRHLPLIIDPILSYSSFFGGSGYDIAWGMAVDTGGSVYIAGETLSAQLPTSPGAFQTNFAGGTSLAGDAFVAKFDNTLSNLVYLTYLGGSTDDGALALAVDSGGNAYITGYTDSTNFPTQSAIFNSVGGTNNPRIGLFPVDAFVTKINSSGSGLVYSTYLGGNGVDEGFGIAVDGANQAYVTGFTESTNFPTANAIQSKLAGNADAFVAKFTVAGSAFVYSTYLGGTNIDRAEGIVADAAGNACIVGFTGSTNFPVTNAIQASLNNLTNSGSALDAFVCKLMPSGNAFVYSTFLGGIRDDIGTSITLDGGGNSFVTGWTISTNFPVTVTNLPSGLRSNSLSRDVFVAGLGSNGTNWIYSTLLGGTGSDEGRALAVDLSGNAYVTGATTSTNFPTINTSGFLRTTNSGSTDVFVAEITPEGSNLVYSVYLGGLRDDIGRSIAIDPAGNALIAGQTASTNFPSVGPFQTLSGKNVDAFLVRIEVPPALVVSAAGSDIQVAWRAFAPAYHLESKAGPGPAWTPVSQAPILTNGWHTVTLGATNEMSLFRLRRN